MYKSFTHITQIGDHLQLFPQRLSKARVKAFATMPKDSLGNIQQVSITAQNNASTIQRRLKMADNMDERVFEILP